MIEGARPFISQLKTVSCKIDAHRRKFLKEIFALFRPNFARQDKGGTLARFARSGLFTLCAARS